ncbi:MAG: tetratricopeptide repeat protein [Planctomycetota bacterium]|jgi:serine/threonine-protein kinase
MAAAEQSILQRLEATGQKAPRLRLRSGEAATPVLRQSGRFEVLGELARGGVGQILRGRDVDLGRDVALKVLREGHRSNPELVQRFVDEAQIGGQLQHPGIVPVYELGIHEDERPFFAMKLVKGRTLAALVKERTEPRRRLLQIFEVICQTIAHAHVRGVIHRDLKPANVMVGAFGEVQVLDWGFAKVLPRGGVADEQPTPDVTRVATLRSTGEGSESIAGSVMGTPAYMPPEQALGEVEAMDERSDVFSLGAILCEILTGRPPYTGDDVLMQAAQARLEDALQRLDACGADAELVALAKRCLQSQRKDRPRDARELAETTHEYLAAVEERAHRAAVEAARASGEAEQARTEAADQRRARRLSLAIGASLLLAVVIAGGGFFLVDRMQRERSERTHLAIQDAKSQAQRLRGANRWTEALTAARQAEELARADEVDAATHAGTLRLVALIDEEAAQARDEAERRREEAEFVVELEQIRLQHGEDFDRVRTDAAYVAAFRERGIDFADPEEAAQRIRDEYAAILPDVVAALDEWAWLRRKQVGDRDWRVLRAAAHSADPDPWRIKLRDAATDGDLDRLRGLAVEALDQELPVRTLALLGVHLDEAGDAEAAVAYLHEVHRRHPADFWVNWRLGLFYHQRLDERRPLEAIRFYTSALALRQSASAHLNLSSALLQAGMLDEAIAVCREAIRRDPRDAKAYVNLTSALSRKGLWDDAMREIREAIRIDPRIANAHVSLGAVLHNKGLFSQAVEALREAVRLEPSADNHFRLGNNLLRLGKDTAAATEFREAIRLDPDNARSHFYLGRILAKEGSIDAAMESYRRAIRADPGLVGARVNLGNLLDRKGQHDDAIACYRAAIDVNPDRGQRGHRANAYINLGHVLRQTGQRDEAIVALREAARLAPNNAHFHTFLGRDFLKLDLLDEAEASYRKVIALDPRHGNALNDLGVVFLRKRQYEEAEKTWRRAMDVDPKNALAHRNLGVALLKKARVDEAITFFGKAIEADPGFVDAHTDLGLALLRKGLVNDALSRLREATQLDPACGRAQWVLGDALREKGRLDDAAAAYRGADAAFREANAAEPLDWGSLQTSAWFLVAVAQPDLRRPDEAAEFARRVIQVAPHAWNYRSLGVALYRQGDWSNAVKALETAIGLEFGVTGTDWFFVAMAKSKLGREQEARRAYEAAVTWMEEHEPANPQLKRFRAEAEEVLGLGSRSEPRAED